MSVTPKPDDGEQTVEIPAEIARWLATSKRARKRRLLAFSAATGIVFIVGMAAGWFFFLRNEKSLAVSGQPARADAEAARLAVAHERRVPRHRFRRAARHRRSRAAGRESHLCLRDPVF